MIITLSNLSVVVTYFSLALLFTELDYETSDEADNPRAYWKYLLVNILTWWITMFILGGRLIRFIKRERRKK